MRRFSTEYLATTRAGLWAANPDALDPMAVDDHDRIVDVGAGSGEFTAVLADRARPTASILAVDADLGLLREAPGQTVCGDATRLPLGADRAGLVCCQALLVNLPEPRAAVEEFYRVTSRLGAAVEPDNGAVRVHSTVEREGELSARLRSAFIDGARTDLTLGSVDDVFEAVGFRDVRTRRVEYTQETEPPYSTTDVEVARRKARGTALESHRDTLLAGGLSESTYETLMAEWQGMGRRVVDQMATDSYRRVERVPYYVTVGLV